MHVLILEDEEISRSALVKILQKIDPDMEVHAAATLKEAVDLLYQEQKYQLFLLDVNLSKEDPEDISGITFAKEIRDIYSYELTPIIMITSVGAMEMDAYRKIHCYQYVLKPFEEAEIHRIVCKVLAHTKEEEEAFITVKKEGINYRIACNDILYIEAIPRGVLFHLKEEQMQVPYLTIRQLMQRLPEERFFQCHRMFVANKEYVEYFDLVNQFIKLRGFPEEIDIGVTYKAEVRRLMNE